MNKSIFVTGGKFRVKIETKTCVKIGVSIFILYLCIHYWSGVAGLLGALIGAAAPLFIGCAIAYIINILMSFYERHYFPGTKHAVIERSRRPVSMIAAMLTLIAAIVLIIVLIVPRLIDCVQLIFAKLPEALKSLSVWLDELDVLPEDITGFLRTTDWQSKLSQIIRVLTSGVSDAVGAVAGIVSSVFSGIVTAFLSMIFAIYLLMGKDKLRGQADRLMKRYLRPAWHDKLMYFIRILNDCFHSYIVGQCTEAVILGVLCALGMWILRLPYATMIGSLIAFTALIPVAGAYIGGGIGAFMIFTVSPVKAVIFIVFLVILQQIEGNLIYPRVVGSAMGLPGIWVLASVTVGGGIMGIGGMLIGVPLAATAYRVIRNDVNKNGAIENTEIILND